MTGQLRITVVGIPAPQGSKRGFYNQGTGRVQMVESSKKVKPWRQDVKAAAIQAMEAVGWATTAEPVELVITFLMPRPGYHYGTGRNAGVLKQTAPTWVSKKPDVSKLVRSTEDALTEAQVYRDDAQVARLVVDQVYADGRPGAEIRVIPLTAVLARVGEGEGEAPEPAPAGTAHHPITVQEALL